METAPESFEGQVIENTDPKLFGVSRSVFIVASILIASTLIIAGVFFIFIAREKNKSMPPPQPLDINTAEENEHHVIDETRANIPEVFISKDTVYTEPVVSNQPVTFVPLTETETETDAGKFTADSAKPEPSQPAQPTVTRTSAVQFGEITIIETKPSGAANTTISGEVMDVDARAGLLLVYVDAAVLRIETTTDTKTTALGSAIPMAGIERNDLVDIVGVMDQDETTIFADSINVTGTAHHLQ